MFFDSNNNNLPKYILRLLTAENFYGILMLFLGGFRLLNLKCVALAHPRMARLSPDRDLNAERNEPLSHADLEHLGKGWIVRGTAN